MAQSAPELLLVLTTVGTRADAERLARSMVEQCLAACVQWSDIDSIYRWGGALQQDSEVRLLLKTEASRYPALEAALRREHPYELPAIVAVPCSAALPEFSDWVAQECAPTGVLSAPPAAE